MRQYSYICAEVTKEILKALTEVDTSKIRDFINFITIFRDLKLPIE